LAKIRKRVFSIKTFYKNQLEVAEAINNTIDSYWKNDTDDEEMMQQIKSIARNNGSLLCRMN
jgi:uncharacterized protein (TIGR04540 family)